MKVIDARGLSCPEPVVLLRAAMQSGEASTRAIRSRCRKTAANGR